MDFKKVIWILTAAVIICACAGIEAPGYIRTTDTEEQGNTSGTGETNPDDGTGTDPDHEGGETPDDGDIQFPDPILKAYILYLYDADGDGFLNEEEACSVNRIQIRNNDLESARGIEHLPYLVELSLNGAANSESLPSDGKLTSVDVSHNTLLRTLIFDYQNLTELDVSHNTNLTYLGVFKSPIKSIDVHNNVNLELLGTGFCQLDSIDVSGLEKLDELQLDHNKLTRIKLSDNKVLRCINASYNRLTELDLTGCPRIEEIHTEGNPGLKTITLRKGQFLGIVTKDPETTLEYVD